jgi:hypothetical protein
MLPTMAGAKEKFVLSGLDIIDAFRLITELASNIMWCRVLPVFSCCPQCVPGAPRCAPFNTLRILAQVYKDLA